MPTQSELIKERQLLHGLGLGPVRIWPARCTWYNADGSVNGVLPCDPYSRLLYMGKGLRPGVGLATKQHRSKTLEDAVVDLIRNTGTWDGTATELLEILEGSVADIPVDATRLSKSLNKLASQLAVRGVTLQRTKTRNMRGLRLLRR